MIAKYNSHVEDEMFRTYMASILYWQGQGKTLTVTYEDYKHPKPIDDRTGDEIAIDIINKLGLRLE